MLLVPSLLCSCSISELDLSEALIIEGEEFLCPFCRGETAELETLIKHVDDEHAYHQRSAVLCWPTCNFCKVLYTSA